MLKYFGNNEFPRCHYINFEQDGRLSRLFDPNLEPKSIITALSFYLDKSINYQQDLLIFDEIQACPRALTSLKYFQESLPELALCCAGSLLGVQLAPASFPVGKVTVLTLYPMSFSEFLLAIDNEKALAYLEQCSQHAPIPEVVREHLWERLKWYFIVGGLPEVVAVFRNEFDNLYRAFDLARQKQQQLILAYNADMAKHAGKINAMQLGRLWSAVPAQLARTQDGSASKFQFKGMVPGIVRYQRLAGAIDWLVSAVLAIKIPIINHVEFPLTAYTKENRFKLYMFDVGILGALSQLPAKVMVAYEYGTYKGYFAENFIAQEFLTRGAEFYSWQENRAEVEFLRVVNSTIIPIEVKSGWVTRAQSLQRYSEKYRPPYRVIFSARPLLVDSRNQLHYYPLYLAYRFPFSAHVNLDKR